jgi:hypothetical protein
LLKEKSFDRFSDSADTAGKEINMDELMSALFVPQVIAIVVTMLVIVLSRGFWCWFFRFKEIADGQKETNRLLSEVVKGLADVAETVQLGADAAESERLDIENAISDLHLGRHKIAGKE